MKENQITLFGLTLKAILAHTLTYFLVGLVASIVFNYSADFARPELRSYMRQLGDPVIALGPALQPLRGILFALAFYPLRGDFLAVWSRLRLRGRRHLHHTADPGSILLRRHAGDPLAILPVFHASLLLDQPS